MNDDLYEDNHYYLDDQAAAAGEAPGRGRGDDDGYGTGTGRSSKNRAAGERQSASHLLRAEAMKKIRAGDDRFQRDSRQHVNNIDDVEYGMDGLSAREEEDDWARDDADQAAAAGGSRRNGRSGRNRARAGHQDDDWAREGGSLEDEGQAEESRPNGAAPALEGQDCS